MKRVFFLIFCICLMQIAQAQTGNDQKDKSWRSKFPGIWRIDSNVSYKGGKRTDKGPDQNEKVFIKLMTDGRAVISSEKFFMVTSYELLEGESKRFINLREWFQFQVLSIEKLTENNITIRVNMPMPWGKNTDEDLMYISRVSSAPEPSVKQLVAKYFVIPNEPAVRADYMDREPDLKLSDDGKMVSRMDAKKDSGTWKFNSENLTIDLIGKRSKKQLEIRRFFMDGLVVHPKYEAKDSVLVMQKKMSLEDFSTMFNPPVPVEKKDAEPQKEDEEKEPLPVPVYSPGRMGISDEHLTNKWKAVAEQKIDYMVRKADSIKANVELNLMENGSFTFQEGKKTQHGQWRSVRNENILILTSGKTEQMIYYVLKNEYSPNRSLKMEFTFNDPKTGNVKRYIFLKQK